MNGASKILTVSYGTFSCTLEGFDDPFNTMKAIAEYFRDLAAEDRYFGAEPPTPDAAMLHRIAEREIQRRVEAKIQENGVVLRASEAEASPAVAAPVTAPSVMPAAAPAAVASAIVAEAAAPEAPAVVAVEAAPAAALAPTVTESVVEKLSRLRSEIAAQPAAPQAQTTPIVSFALPDYAEDLEAETLEAGVASALADFLPEEEAAVEAELPEERGDDAVDATEAAVTMPEEAVVAAETVTDDLSLDDIDLGAVMDAAQSDAMEATATEVAVEPEAEAPVIAPQDDAAETASPEMPDLSDTLMAALAEPDMAEEITVTADEGAAVEPAVVADIWPEQDEMVSAEAALDSDADMMAALGQVMEAETAPAEPAVVEETAHTEEMAEDMLVEADAPALAAMDADDLPAAQAEVPSLDEAMVTEAPLTEPVADLPVAAPVEAPVEPSVETPVETPVDAVQAEAPRTEAPRTAAAEKLMRARARVVRIRRGEDTSGAIDAKAVELPAAPEASVPEAIVAETPAQVAQTDVPAPEAIAPVAEPEAAAPEAAAPVAEAEPTLAAMVDTPAVEDRTEINAVQAKVAESMAEGRTPLLSPEDEAALQRELAALMRNDEEAQQDGQSVTALQAEQRRGFEGPSADEALSRLMQQTDSEMSGSETKRRQSAIAHLKAAVAATVADRKVAGEKSGETETVSRLARYRNDLAMAVKAALPGRGGAAAAPQGERPAPLVLVSEQRIDRPRTSSTAAPAAASSAPIRPRRVTAGGLGMATAAEFGAQDEDEDEGEDVTNLFGDTRGFAEFVEKVGATGLEQVLEASAAYLAGVEGRPHFSRPQLMRHLSAVVPAESFQREDGLRSFGTLLREGRIAKVRRGQFTVSEESRYLAEARKIAG